MGQYNVYIYDVCDFDGDALLLSLSTLFFVYFDLQLFQHHGNGMKKNQVTPQSIRKNFKNIDVQSGFAPKAHQIKCNAYLIICLFVCMSFCILEVPSFFESICFFHDTEMYATPQFDGVKNNFDTFWREKKNVTHLR